MELKDQLRLLMDETKTTQASLVMKSGVSKSLISDVLAGKQGILDPNLLKICDALRQNFAAIRSTVRACCHCVSPGR